HMPIPAVLSYAAAYLTMIVMLGILLRDRRSFVHRTFAVGMFLFAAEEVFRGVSAGSVLPEEIIYWQKRVVAASALMPAVWLAFSVTYARANAEKLLSKWKWAFLAVAFAPIPFIAVFRKSLFTGAIYLENSDRWSILLGGPGRILQF